MEEEDLEVYNNFIFIVVSGIKIDMIIYIFKNMIFFICSNI